MENQETVNEAADLNGDGVVDLVDLQMLAANLDDARDTQATIQTSIPETLTAVEKDEKTAVVGGSLENLMSGTETVTLQPAADQPISEDSPVTVSFDFEQVAGSTVPMAGMVVQTPADSDNAVTGATVVVEYEENGEPKSMEIPVVSSAMAMLARLGGNVATVQPDGSIVVDFGGQIAVKKVTIKVTATSNSGNLPRSPRWSSSTTWTAVSRRRP